jgi:hypothetical protein
LNLKHLSIIFALGSALQLSAVESENEFEVQEQVDGAVDKEDLPLKVGMFVFPTSQQLTPLISFGQTLLDKNQCQLFLNTIVIEGEKHSSVVLTPNFLYGLTDKLTLFLSAPQFVRNTELEEHSAGPGDLLVQLEYSLYTKAYRTFYYQMTILGSVTIPTGAFHKHPPTGLGAPSYFLGTTFSRNGPDWFLFTSYGGLFPTAHHGDRPGYEFLYQYGLGRRITQSEKWLYCCLLELDGVYSWKGKLAGNTDPNSGGNQIFLTPSIFISSVEHFIFQFGAGFPVAQHLNGDQLKNDWLLQMNLGWTF